MIQLDLFTAYLLFLISSAIMLIANFYLIRKGSPRFLFLGTLSYILFLLSVLAIIMQPLLPEYLHFLPSMLLYASVHAYAEMVERLKNKRGVSWRQLMIFLPFYFFVLISYSSGLNCSLCSALNGLFYAGLYILIAARLSSHKNIVEKESKFLWKITGLCSAITTALALVWSTRSIIVLLEEFSRETDLLTNTVTNVLILLIIPPLMLILNIIFILLAVETDNRRLQNIQAASILSQFDIFQNKVISELNEFANDQLVEARAELQNVSAEMPAKAREHMFRKILSEMQDVNSIFSSRNNLLNTHVKAIDTVDLEKFLEQVTRVLRVIKIDRILYTCIDCQKVIEVSEKYLFWILYTMAEIIQANLPSDYSKPKEIYLTILPENTVKYDHRLVLQAWHKTEKNGSEPRIFNEFTDNDDCRFIWVKGFVQSYFDGKLFLGDREREGKIFQLHFDGKILSNHK